MKIDAVQMHKLHEALRQAGDVLREVKLRELGSADVRTMKTLEASVQSLEVVICQVRVNGVGKRLPFQERKKGKIK